jgi:hypothetical protein
MVFTSAISRHCGTRVFAVPNLPSEATQKPQKTIKESEQKFGGTEAPTIFHVPP